MGRTSKAKRRRLLRRAKWLVIPFVLSLAGVLSVFIIISRLERPEYAAMVIAVVGIAFTAWLEAFREVSSRGRGQLAVLSQLSIELTQNKNDMRAVLDGCSNDTEESVNPAPLRTHAWLVATASPHFARVKAETVEQLISIYNRTDAANYYADVFRVVAYSPQEVTWHSSGTADRSRGLYLSIVNVVADQIDAVLPTIVELVEELREY